MTDETDVSLKIYDVAPDYRLPEEYLSDILDTLDRMLAIISDINAGLKSGRDDLRAYDALQIAAASDMYTALNNLLIAVKPFCEKHNLTTIEVRNAARAAAAAIKKARGE